MILGLVLKRYDYKYVLKACYVCMDSLTAIYDCRSGLQQTIIVRLVLTKCYDSRYRLSAGLDYRMALVQAVITCFMVRSIFLIIFSFRSQLFLGSDCVIM
jgi:hypothetical protein